MHKKAVLGQLPSQALYLLGAIFALGSVGAGVGAGYLTGKVTQPGEYDMQNLQKQHRLARLKRDNQTQKIMQQRQAAQRNMRDSTKKAVRMF